jgi:hypothetical protein
VAAICGAASSAEPTDRRQVASALAAHPGDSAALEAVRRLLRDPDADVRAQAAWSLGTLGDAPDESPLVAIVHSAEIDAATNATAALGRIASRLRSPELAARALCPLATEARPSVRANALAGLALAGVRCGDGDLERRALTQDPSEDVRAAAAAAVASTRTPGVEDTRALDLCARTDPSGAVALRCRSTPPRPGASHALLVYVVPEGATIPQPGAPFALLLPDGLLHAGTSDRRGAVFDPSAPEGLVTLRQPAALLR